jgi:glycosyltransferase involved in cell wall biosynthesis
MNVATEVSVVIPTRNRWPLLAGRALRSAQLQEAVACEIIVVDDGSTDETPSRLEALADPRVRVIRRPRPGGVAQARNVGIQAAQSPWIAFLDDDDAWAPNKLRIQLDAVQETGADFVYSGGVVVDAQGAVLYNLPVPPPERLRYETVPVCAIPAGPSNVLVRTELVRRLGGFDENLSQLEDWDLWIRLAWAGRAAARPDIAVAYLEHGESTSLTSRRVTFDHLDYLERKHRQLLDEQGLAIDRVAFAHYIAWLELRGRRHASAARLYLRSALANRRPRDLVPAARFAARAVIPGRRARRRPDGRGSEAPSWLALYA